MKQENSLDDWISFEQLANEHPAFPVKTLRYLARAEVRTETGFEACLRFVTARKMVVSRAQFAKWIDRRVA